jgi:hypothetical protein
MQARVWRANSFFRWSRNLKFIGDGLAPRLFATGPASSPSTQTFTLSVFVKAVSTMADQVKGAVQATADMTSNIVHAAVETPMGMVSKGVELGQEGVSKGVDATNDAVNAGTSMFDNVWSNITSCFGILK